MNQISTPAIMLKRIEYGDFDLIITFFSRDLGKISVIAKSAKKSKKRFAGILEPFSVLQIVYGTGKTKGLPVLSEAALIAAFPNIRQDITKTAYASYMAELIYEWTEENHGQPALFFLFKEVLQALDKPDTGSDGLSMLFQIRFLVLSGFSPNLTACALCRSPVDHMDQNRITVDLRKGGIICQRCRPGRGEGMTLSKGTLKQLAWFAHPDLKMAMRMKPTATAVAEGLLFLEAFVPFHLGKEPRSLRFLKQLRMK